MESPFELMERHDDHAHSDETFHEKPVLPKRTQNLDPLLRTASGDQLDYSKVQISATTSLRSWRFFSSACWRKNGFCLAQEDQEHGKKLARIQRALPQQRLIFSPLALMLSHSEGCQHDTSAQLCLCQCDDAPPPDPNRHTDRWWPGFHMLTPQHPKGINWTWGNAVSDSNRFIKHCQAGFREESSLCEVRAPNKFLHTKQDTTHFLFFDGDTIQADSELLTMRWRPRDHKLCQLEHLKQQKLIRRTGQLIGVEATT